MNLRVRTVIEIQKDYKDDNTDYINNDTMWDFKAVRLYSHYIIIIPLREESPRKIRETSCRKKSEDERLWRLL